VGMDQTVAAQSLAFCSSSVRGASAAGMSLAAAAG
jgi:hypothetical protein